MYITLPSIVLCSILLYTIQYSGGHLKDALAALRNPMSNPGLIVGKAVEKAKRSMGVVTPISVTGAHSQLAAEADKMGMCIAMFGGSVEDLLAKYQKKIVGE